MGGMKEHSNTNLFDRKPVPKEVVPQSKMAEHVPNTNFRTGLDLKENTASHSGSKNSAHEMQRDATYSRARLPPLSKIPNSAVEMPGDFSTGLDIQFGNLDLNNAHSNKPDNLSLIDSTLFSQSRAQNQFLGQNVA